MWRGEQQRAVVKRGTLHCRVAGIASCQETERVLRRQQATVGLDRCRPAEARPARHWGAGAVLLGDTAGRPGREARGDGGEAGSGGSGTRCAGLGPPGTSSRVSTWVARPDLGTGSMAPSPSWSHLWCPGGFCSLAFIGPSPSFSFWLCSECHGPQRTGQNHPCLHRAWKETFGPRHPEEAGRVSWRRQPEERALGLHRRWWGGTCSVNCDTRDFGQLLASA